jgi:hypothetical protein
MLIFRRYFGSEVKGIKVRTVIKVRDNPGTKTWAPSDGTKHPVLKFSFNVLTKPIISHIPRVSNQINSWLVKARYSIIKCIIIVLNVTNGTFIYSSRQPFKKLAPFSQSNRVVRFGYYNYFVFVCSYCLFSCPSLCPWIVTNFDHCSNLYSLHFTSKITTKDQGRSPTIDLHFALVWWNTWPPEAFFDSEWSIFKNVLLWNYNTK